MTTIWYKTIKNYFTKYYLFIIEFYSPTFILMEIWQIIYFLFAKIIFTYFLNL